MIDHQQKPNWKMSDLLWLQLVPTGGRLLRLSQWSGRENLQGKLHISNGKIIWFPMFHWTNLLSVDWILTGIQAVLENLVELMVATSSYPKLPRLSSQLWGGSFGMEELSTLSLQNNGAIGWLVTFWKRTCPMLCSLQLDEPGARTLRFFGDSQIFGQVISPVTKPH